MFVTSTISCIMATCQRTSRGALRQPVVFTKGEGMAKEPTEKQRAVFDFVCEAIRHEGRPPTVREVADHFGYASPKVATDHLNALEKKGYISLRRGTSRNIEVFEKLDPRGIPVVNAIDPDTPVLTLDKVEKSLTPSTVFDVGQDTVAVHVQDGSMESAGIREGDYVVVEGKERVENGSIAAVQVKDEILVRRVFRQGNGLRLVAEGADISDIMGKKESEEIRIVGPVKGVVRRL